MSGKADLVNGWLAKADSDLEAGRRLLVGGPYDVVCFHAQQVIEKLLKALLAFYNQPPPRTRSGRTPTVVAGGQQQPWLSRS